MANQPGVEFTRPAAERIAKVVRKVEAGGRKAAGFNQIPRLQHFPRTLTVGMFTGEWNINVAKAVRILPGTATTVVYNYCVPVPESPSTTEERFVLFGKVQLHNENIGPNSVVEVQIQSTNETCANSIGGLALGDLPEYADGDVQLLGHDGSACLKWVSLTTCETAVATVPDEYGWFY